MPGWTGIHMLATLSPEDGYGRELWDRVSRKDNLKEQINTIKTRINTTIKDLWPERDNRRA